MDLTGVALPFLVLLCLVLFLWKSRRKAVLGALIYAFIEVWIEPLFTISGATSRFVFVATKVLLVFFTVWMLLRGEKGGES